MQTTQAETHNSEPSNRPSYSTVALSLLVHGEAVRYNRGKTGSGRYDFKHMTGPKGSVIPYVSSQCFKKHWRETLPTTPSPIIRERDSRGQEKNQAYTSGDPMRYVDDDLFGYMIAGAAEVEAGDSGETGVESETDSVDSPEALDDKLAAISVSPDQLKADKTWIKLLKDDSNPLANVIVASFGAEEKTEFDSTPDSANLSDNLRSAITSALNGLLDANETTNVFNATYFPDLGKKSGKKQADALNIKNEVTVRMTRLELLQKAFGKGFETKKKRETTKRTAPIRMHALVGFSGIKLAEDFQTFSRDVTLTGKNSILNPNPVGIYSGWLKTRVLIESFRVGKFYIGGNLDILRDQIGEHAVENEFNPYDRQNGTVEFVQLPYQERNQRVAAALESLANIGNSHGPASSALHDGSLKPRAFIGALMNCADSPFDTVWDDNSGTPRLNLTRLKAVLREWDDLFENKTIYIGIAPEMVSNDDIEAFASNVAETLEPLGFKAIVDTPRRAIKQMAGHFAV